ncbi:MAG TPA: hypothetical protein VGN93_01625 [Shinella sp.]|jgi:hypothetical protein|uniref:hypothetical protein n=1 Tax=Shinella sp. TaxID=1870904 RepID=UPI002E11361F|nr:hypothetical protein [Shinella sp.]
MTGQGKSDHQRCKEAVLKELATMGATLDKPIDLYLIGPTLVLAGFTEQQIVNALDSLVYDKRIEYAGGNRVRLTR